VDVYCTSYITGNLGVAIDSNLNNLAISSQTNGYVSLSKEIHVSANKEVRFYIGGLNNANLSGKIRNLFLEEVSSDEKKMNNKCSFENIFINEMNNKCTLFNMTTTSFKNPSGLNQTGQYTTANDMAKLAINVLENSTLLKIWRTKKHIINLGGNNERVVEIKTTVKNIDYESCYHVLGGKTGSLTPNIFNLMLLSSDDDDQLFLTIVLKSNTKKNSFIDAKKLIDYATEASPLDLNSHSLDINALEPLSHVV